MGGRLARITCHEAKKARPPWLRSATREGTRLRVAQHRPVQHAANDFVAAVENLCIIRATMINKDCRHSPG